MDRERKCLLKEEEAARKAKEKKQKEAQRGRKRPENMRIPLKRNRTLRSQMQTKARCSVTANSREDQNVCSVCLGNYEDDIIDGVLQKEWVRCMNIENCGVWMYANCLSTEENSFVCYICNVTFN